jgi:hypothetical protein
MSLIIAVQRWPGKLAVTGSVDWQPARESPELPVIGLYSEVLSQATWRRARSVVAPNGPQ